MNITEDLKKRQEILWLNPYLDELLPYEKINGYGFAYMKAAQNRFMRFLPYIAAVFPETADRKGVIESPLVEITEMKKAMQERGTDLRGRLFLKDDARLPIAGSVKARGGIHAVLKIAEQLAQQEGMMLPAEDHTRMNSPEFRSFFGQYTIHTGSTGNLGLAIGRTAAAMGFSVVVHMSVHAKEWKKQLLREAGAQIREYDTSYTEALAAGRRAAGEEPRGIFIDDENSEDLFFGYATAAMRLKVQLKKLGIEVDREHPLFVYLPCGVGGAPGGITFGLKEMFGDAVHCFFGEPVEAPCLLLGMASEKYSDISVEEIGLTGQTVADGLAVTRPSEFVCNMMGDLLSGAYTVSDEHLLAYQKECMELEGLYLEPSACAGFAGAERMGRQDSSWQAYIAGKKLAPVMDNAVHIVWGTGGGLVPEQLR